MTLKIELEDNCFFELEVISSGTAGVAYDCGLRATLKSEISGGNREFYVDGGDVVSFISELKSLCATLKGTAILVSESPGDFELKLVPVDSLGHFAISISIGRQFFIGNETFNSVASNSFSLESERLISVSKKLVDFFEEVSNA